MNEPEAAAILKAMEQSRRALVISPIVHIETTLSVARSLKDADCAEHTNEFHFDQASELVANLIDSLKLKELPTTEEMGTAAVVALRKCGQITGHPAKLNMGDALAHAAAGNLGEPMLYKGTGFAKTDLA